MIADPGGSATTPTCTRAPPGVLTSDDDSARAESGSVANVGASGYSDELASLIQGDASWRVIADTSVDFGMAIVDLDGRIVTWNAGAEKITGFDSAELSGRSLASLFPADATPTASPDYLLQLVMEEGRAEYEGWLLRHNTARFWANLVLAPVRSPEGHVAGFTLIVRDFDARRRHEERVRQSVERFRILVEQVKDYAIFLLDTEGIVVSWNQGAQRIKGYDAGEIIGEHFSRFYLPEDLERGKPDWELKVARAEGRVEDEGWRVRKDGSRFWANIVITALHNPDGSLRGFAKVTRDMTERKRIEALEEGERRTNEFLAMLAHELRNPLAPIRNAVGVLRARGVDDPHVRRTRDVIERQVTQLARLVDDLLDVSRITTGKITLHRESVDLSDIVARAVEETKSMFEQRRQQLDLHLSPTPLRVNGDRVRLVQIVTNLLANAAKFTPEGGYVRLAVEARGTNVEISVRDNGVGIPADLLPRVFDLFIQGDRSLDHSSGGLGIGLTLVKRLVLLHGGVVEARSEGVGRGSTFVVCLPLEDASPNESTGRSSSEVHPMASRLLKVLVVDDNVDSAESMAMLLDAWGFTVLTATEGMTALEIASDAKPDAVLLDIGLPGMSGYEVAEQLRARMGDSRPLLIAMTGYGQADDRRRTRESGFHHHLIKPVEFDALWKILESV
jgi:PAS domain S-box-containing protein